MVDGISLEHVGAVSLIIGTILGTFGLWWLLIRVVLMWIRKQPRSRLRAPLWTLAVSVLLTTVPIAVNSVLTRIDTLGPLNKIVGGERHLTLTGWDGKDYAVILPHIDTVVLQMANADVTDETLKYLTNMKQLQELDLNNSQVTDTGLAMIAVLPKLRELRLARTKITDEGFRNHLLAKETVMKLDLTGTSVASKTVREWKAAKPDRSALK